jgi:hypothetical protein
VDCEKISRWKRHILTQKHHAKCQEDGYGEKDEKEKEKENIIVEIIPENSIPVDVVMKLILQNDEMKNILVEQTEEMRTQNKLILDKMETTSKNIVVASNNCNNTTNKFNLNVFLNEQCKDAMNMNDFIDSIETTLEDAIATTRLGFVEGVTKQIEKLTANIGGIHRRPFHCTDEKRSILMIKNNNEWTKDESVDKAELMRLVNKVEGSNSCTFY